MAFLGWQIVAKTGSKLPVVKTLIIGGGPAGKKAAELVNKLPLDIVKKSADVDVVCMGGPGMWLPIAQSNPSLLMGQPGILLETDVRRMTSQHVQPFMPVVSYAQSERIKEQQLREQHGTRFIQDKILSIFKGDRNEYLVTTTSLDQFIARSIVVASGVGDPISTSSLGLARNKPLKQRRPFIEDLDAQSFLMTGGSATGGTTIVLGGGPSAAWVAADAKRHHNQVIWVASQEHGGFTGADPGGRNTMILRSLRESMFLGNLEGVLFRSLQEPGDASKGGVVVRLSSFRSAYEGGQGHEIELLVSQIVTAFGSDNSRALSILDPMLFNDLGAIVDTAGAFSDSPLDAAIGLRSKDSDLLVVGAAAARGMSVKGLSLQWGNIAQTLPPSARPFEGIAMSNATIEAMANYVSFEYPNMYTANRNQIAEFLKRLSPVSGEGRRLTVADKIIEERVKLQGSDFASWDVAKIIRDGL